MWLLHIVVTGWRGDREGRGRTYIHFGEVIEKCRWFGAAREEGV